MPEEIMKTCALLFSGYQTSTCLTPCQTTETKSKRVSKLDLSKPDEMRIMIKFNPTVTVTTTDFVKSTMGVFMSEVWSFLRLITCLSWVSTSIILWNYYRLVARWDSGLGLVLFR